MELAEITLFKNEADLLTERVRVYEDELYSSLDLFTAAHRDNKRKFGKWEVIK